MRTLRTVGEMRAALAQLHRSGRRIGLVPTMGAFHEGHLSLMRRAREDCDELVVSLFVNPAQFNDSRDLTAYPRDEGRDAGLAGETGVDLLFAPEPGELYPPGFATTVSVAGLSDLLEGAHRGRGHFDGVVTIVTKLLNIVAPDIAYFGHKDIQQVRVVQRLVRDLDMSVRIEVCPTVREPDGLAMSSRNALLTPDQRARAAALHRSLRVADRAARAGERDPAPIVALARAELDAAGVETEYFELVSADTLAPVQEVAGAVLAVVAARVGTTRLIDNHMLSTATQVAGLPSREARSVAHAAAAGS